MQPLKLSPAFKDYIWGGEKLKKKFGKQADTETVAESWELSCHPDGLSTVSGGEYDKMTLKSFLEAHPEALGTANKGSELPILIKLIDASDNLSVQVHPNNEQAKEWENQNGKTEMWYVIDADKDASIIYGVREDISEEKLKDAIQENTVLDLLDSVPSHKGDVFFVEAGTIHAIGKGNLIAEIQQNSNVTYRLYDYGRLGKDGKPRQLHIEKGIKAAKTKKITPRRIPSCSDGTRLLGSCEYFQVKELTLAGLKTLSVCKKSYQALIVTTGEIKLICEEFCDTLCAGTTVFLPAGLGEYTLSGQGTVLITSNPPRYFVDVVWDKEHISAAVTDEFGVTYGSAEVKIQTGAPDNDLPDVIASCARKCAEESGICFDDTECVRLGYTDTVGEDGVSDSALSRRLAIQDYLEKILNKTVCFGTADK